MDKLQEILSGRQLSLAKLVSLGVTKIEDNTIVSRQALSLKAGCFTCQRCGFIGRAKDHELTADRFYCPNCIHLGRLTTADTLYSIPEANNFKKLSKTPLVKRLVLSKWQEKCALELIFSFEKRTDRLLWAVTGAGKTEMLYPVLEKALLSGARICIATPRVDVCNELYPRICEAFPKVKTTLLYHESGQKYEYTQLCVCTVHQLFNFYHAFDFLIIDEIDAFPYVDDKSLHFATKNAKKLDGCTLFLTATPNKAYLQKIKHHKLEVSYLPLRYHMHFLPEITLLKVTSLKQAVKRLAKSYLKKWAKNNKPFLVFVPKISLLSQVLAEFRQTLPNKRGESIYSADENRLKKVQALRDNELDYLITTTILERGITIKSLNVIVLFAESETFTKTSLVQIAGRVGRAKSDPKGDVIFCYRQMQTKLQDAKKEIKQSNRSAKRLLANEEMFTM